MKALITGIGGFAGGHLAQHLLEIGDTQVVGTTFLPTDRHPHLTKAGIDLFHIDLADENAVIETLRQVKPDCIYHLAAQSFVPESFSNPWATLSNNIRAQLNLLQAVLTLKLDSRILVIGSGEEYGPVTPDDNPISESHPLKPANPYSVSKVTQDMLGLQYFLSHHLPIIRVRPFNHTGPGQSDRFVAPAFASQIAKIEAYLQEPVVRVGHLDAKRDFTDVRDMVAAYQLVMLYGAPGEVYNIGSGKAHSIRELLETLLVLSSQAINVETDPERLRPVDVPLVVCDNRKVKSTTGWNPQYDFEDTMADILIDWRDRIADGARDT